MRKHILASKNSKAFTLIELLAIIVILAIIAVITVPIILNIIENSRRGAATDSAFGFKDAISKYYVSELSNNGQLQLDGDYTVTDGVLDGDGIENKTIPVSGIVPTSGALKYSKNILTSGCLVIGEYAVTFNADGTTSTEKGECSSTSTVGPAIESCPGCTSYIFTTNKLTIGTDTIPSGATNDYTTLTQHPFFLGFVANPTTKVIERAFACGVEGTKTFCLEGHDATKWSDDTNIGILNDTFKTGCRKSDYVMFCDGTSVDAGAVFDGAVHVDMYNTTDQACGITAAGEAFCSES